MPSSPPKLLVACALVFAAAGCAATGSVKGPESADTASNLVGNPAPDFSVTPLAGAKGTVSLKALHGSVVVLDFWGTFCEPCKKSFPKLQHLYAKYGPSGLRIIGLSEDEVDDRDKIPSFAATYGAKFAVGWDEDKAVARVYKPDTMPSTFVIDQKGVVRFAHTGFREGDEVEIEHEIQQLLGR